LFVEDAIQKYKELPEEQNELYKRKYVSLSPEQLFGIFQVKQDNPDTKEEIEALSKSIFVDSSVKFDAIIWGSGHIVNQSQKNIRIVPVSDISMDVLDRKLYKSADDKLASLVHAFTKEIVILDVPEGQKAQINLLFINAAHPLATQVIVNTGKGAELEVFEWYASSSKGDSASAVMHECIAGEYSSIYIDAVHNEDYRTTVVGLSKYNAFNNATLKLNYLYNGGSHSRAKNYFSASGYEASIHVNELVFGSSKQKFDVSSYLENSSQATIAELHSRAVLADQSLCILKGFAKIPFGSKNARSFVYESGMLLNKDAYLESIPAMSIDENEVKATHSSATGPIDDELIFYLMSKGLPEQSAKRLIVEGFLSSSIGKFRNATAKLAGANLVAEKIENGTFGAPVKLSAENIWVGKENEEDIFKGHYKYR
jgi:Fe-S cluster assembly scaffold protein SufB